MLKGKVFCFAGKLSRSHSEFKSQLEKAGAKVTTSITDQTCCLVTNSTEVQRSCPKVEAAKKHSVPIVGESFVTMCLENNTFGDIKQHSLSNKRTHNEAENDSPAYTRVVRRASSPPPTQGRPPKRTKMNAEDTREAIEELFASYTEDSPDKIEVGGMVRLCSDLEVDPCDVVMLVIAWKFGAKQMCEFSKAEFVNGMISLQCSTIQSLKDALPRLRASVQSPLTDNFADFYNFAFTYSLSGPQQKTLPLESAIALWKIVLKQHFKHLDLWIKFLEERHNKAIPRDVWTLLLQFSRSINDHLTNYNEEEAWPVLLDEFVDYARATKQSNV